MDWMVDLGGAWLKTLGWLAGLAVAFGLLARLMPCNPGMYWWKNLRAAGTDFVYWFVVPLFVRACRTFMLIGGVLLLFGGREPQVLPVQGLPLWQQCVAVLLIQDVMLYWIHRLFHTRLAWGFHAVHHSPKVLDWMSTQRSHPVNTVLEFSLADVAVLLLGFSPAALVVLTPLNLVYSALVHANLNWTFGPLKYVFASPVFHRWHHTTQEEGLDKNFASTFPFLDVIFGTFYMPKGLLPERFGTGEADFPEGFWGQLLHPFRAGEGARRQPAALRVGKVLVFVCLLGGGAYYLAWLAYRDGQRAKVAEGASPPPLPARTGRPSAVLGVAVSADGRHVVSASADGALRVWDAATGQEKLTLTGHARAVRAVALSADGKHLVSGGLDKTVKVWDAQTWQEKLTLTGHPSAVLSVAVSADGQRVASASADGTLKVWDAATGRPALCLPSDGGAVPGVALAADGRRLVSASWGTVKVWDAYTGREERALAGHTDLVYSVALSPDGKRIVSGSLDQTVKVWDAATGQEQLTLRGHTGPVYSVALSPDGERIVSGGQDQTVRVWDAGTGRQLLCLKGHTDDVTGVAVSGADRRIVSGGRDGALKFWGAEPSASPDKVGLTRRD
jgi:WD40 repeat protein/sterol desaturase/sphingolipid hydroxylase (fatty acid hydroxylase superfamily)